MRIKIPFLLCLLACSVTVACAPFGRGVQRLGDNTHTGMVRLDNKIRDVLDKEDMSAQERKGFQVQEAYCYQTWGAIECYAQPLPRERSRLVGKQIPAPVFDAINTPYPHVKPPVPVYEYDEDGKIIEALPQPPQSVTELMERPVPIHSQPLPAAEDHTAPVELMPQ